jgi:tRNA(fMet)-specific endonuclease VapC
LSDFVRENPKIAAHLRGIEAHDRVFTCVIVVGEVKHGIERLPKSRRRQDLEEKTSKALTVCKCKPVPVAAADHYSRIKTYLEQEGLPLDENDLWIAATALDWGARVVSRDEHFRRVPGLTVEDWTQ